MHVVGSIAECHVTVALCALSMIDFECSTGSMVREKCSTHHSSYQSLERRLSLCPPDSGKVVNSSSMSSWCTPVAECRVARLVKHRAATAESIRIHVPLVQCNKKALLTAPLEGSSVETYRVRWRTDFNAKKT